MALHKQSTKSASRKSLLNSHPYVSATTRISTPASPSPA